MEKEVEAQGGLFRAIVFRLLSATADFTQSQRVVLPGQYRTECEAWAAVRAAVSTDPDLVGGAVEPCP